MNKETNMHRTILVVEDVEETRDGIVELLSSNAYCVEAARDERWAVEIAGRRSPDLILVGLGRPLGEGIATAGRIRERAELDERVPVVIFCGGEVEEGGEVAVGPNIYATCPDNFNQLRGLIARLLSEIPNTA
ncbi:MAG TPA: response regulator [Pyrinomonadaceae bacterium]|jgi:CheY-like chemotaxis protein